MAPHLAIDILTHMRIPPEFFPVPFADLSSLWIRSVCFAIPWRGFYFLTSTQCSISVCFRRFSTFVWPWACWPRSEVSVVIPGRGDLSLVS